VDEQDVMYEEVFEIDEMNFWNGKIEDEQQCMCLCVKKERDRGREGGRQSEKVVRTKNNFMSTYPFHLIQKLKTSTRDVAAANDSSCSKSPSQ